MSIQDTIREQVTGNRVVLYMKGTPQFPQCGFSSAAVQMLKACGVNDFATVNVLASEEIRQGVKAYANWPTIPQLYVNGEFVGWADIMREMYESGELQGLLKGGTRLTPTASPTFAESRASSAAFLRSAHAIGRQPCTDIQGAAIRTILYRLTHRAGA